MLSKFKRLLPTASKLIKQSRIPYSSIGSTNLSSRNTDSDFLKRDKHQFSTEGLTDFGDLPPGEIPEALKYDRPIDISQLPNGIKVATQHWPGKLATVSVFIKCGSRQETIENSGVAHFLEHLHFKGTKNRSRTQLELDVENMGGQLNAYTSRENTSYTMTVFKKDAEKAVEILGDMLSNSLYDKKHLEAERETILRECIETQKDQMETTIEAAHYTSFRDHMMGQPILGIRENIDTITRDQIVEYHKANYVGSNILITGAGEITHEQLLLLSEKYFGKLPTNPPAGLESKNTERPLFTPSLMYMRDDEMNHINIGVFFQAPSWTHKDYYSFLLYQRILGDYSDSKNTGGNLSYSERQYNMMHGILSQLPEISLHKAIYAPYSDTGLFGSYFHGNEGQAYQMLYASQLVLSDYANYLNEAEVVRAKNKLYNELLQHESSNDMTQSIGNQLLYLNRIVPRSEIAKRVSSIEVSHLSKVARDWFYDSEVSAVAWGPVHSLMALSHYNSPVKRSSLGWNGEI